MRLSISVLKARFSVVSWWIFWQVWQSVFAVQVICCQLCCGGYSLRTMTYTRCPTYSLGHPILAPLPIGVTLLSKKPAMPLTVRLVCSVNFCLAVIGGFIQSIYL